MKSAAGRAVAAQLVEGADVVIENFRPGAMADNGLDYATLRQRNPGPDGSRRRSCRRHGRVAFPSP